MTPLAADDAPTTARELDDFVHQRLCAMECLLEDQFQTTATPLTRGSRRCGTQYLLSGPRSVRLTAVWNSDRNELYVYDAQGRRAEKLSLPCRVS